KGATDMADAGSATKVKPRQVPDRPIDPGVSIGHVHLKVADIERALGFYCGVLGFELMQRYGAQAAFVSAGGYHHHLGLNTWESAGGPPSPRRGGRPLPLSGPSTTPHRAGARAQ